jgi:hypothetical protein
VFRGLTLMCCDGVLEISIGAQLENVNDESSQYALTRSTDQKCRHITA